MKKFMTTRSREDGFTLIELLVVVIIIAILAAIAVPVYIGIQNNAKKSSIQSDVANTKLNVAAAFAEDQAYNTKYISKSGSPKGETVKVFASDGSTELVNGDTPQQFIVVGTDGNDLGGYTVTYKSGDGSSTGETGTVKLASDPVYTEDFESYALGNPNGPKIYGQITNEQARSGTKSIYSYTTGSSGYTSGIYGLNTTNGKLYTVSGYFYISTDATNWNGNIIFQGMRPQGTTDYNQAFYYNNSDTQAGKWVPFSVTGLVYNASGTNNSVSPSVSISNGTTGKIFLDDLKVTPAS